MKNKPKNIEEAKALIERYRSITLEDINNCRNIDKIYSYKGIANKLTGFGDNLSCSLCKPLNRYEWDMCGECIYQSAAGCQQDERYSNSYQDIDRAETSEDLLQAFKDRADVIENLLKLNNWL